MKTIYEQVYDRLSDRAKTFVSREAVAEVLAAIASDAAPLAWLASDGSDAWTAEKKRNVAEHGGAGGKRMAEAFSIPLGRLDTEQATDWRYRLIGELGCPEDLSDDAIIERVAVLVQHSKSPSKAAPGGLPRAVDLLMRAYVHCPPDLVNEIASFVGSADAAAAHSALKAAEQAPVDEQLTAFDVLLDTYQDAQINGAMKDRVGARRALRAAYRAAVTARPPVAQQAPVDAARGEPNWDSARHSLAVAMCGFASRPEGKRGLDDAAKALDAVTEPGSPLSWLRAAPAQQTAPQEREK